ncbi:MAG: tRNA 5-methoxyuridine(34)/uridine 5-oxyacetic acid(34) synthase CmoB [Gammaproteobacteria bacterium]|nr:tRNA 5-methoxyuridine(34)/uridine 5-oxyacetic acid(34) synthase CmoB [Gammaproteobacteria bacterium]
MVSMYELGFLSRLEMTDNYYPDGLDSWPLHLVRQRLSPDHHGDYNAWAQAIASLPDMDSPRLVVGNEVQIHGKTDTDQLNLALQKLHPWRKGPFRIGQVKLEAEWRSDLKWARLEQGIASLTGHRILDIGCGNGYFGWRMLNAGAHEVIGIDPTILFCMQHQAINHYLRDSRNWVLPLKIEELPATHQFDSVFSMGVIYHRKSLVEHAQQLFDLTKPGGQVVLESIVTLGDGFTPVSRYARMRNVWRIPHPDELKECLHNAGFQQIRILDISQTTTAEQHSTPWMRFESLQQALDPQDPSLTIEGYPAPVRAILTAIK